MKKVKYLAMVGAMLMSLNSYSQGLVSFANDSANNIINSVTGLPATIGTLKVGLYYAAPGTEANPTAPLDGYTQAGLSGNVLANGFFIAGNRTIPGFDAGVAVALQVRAWSAAFNTYEEAYNAGRTDNAVLVGNSAVLNGFLGGGTIPTPNLVVQFGLQRFSVAPVPEPSMIALSLLGGLGAMVLLRRRK